MFSLTTTDHQYIRNADHSEELYDLRQDPGETANLATTADGAPALNRLREALNRLLQETAKAAPPSRQPPQTDRGPNPE